MEVKGKKKTEDSRREIQVNSGVETKLGQAQVSGATRNSLAGT